MNNEELLDINGNIKTWNRLKSIEYVSGINGLTKYNSKLAIFMLKDFENGIDCTTKGIRSPASLLRIRRTWRVLEKRLGKKNNSIDEQTKEKISQILIKEGTEDFAKNVKVIYNWLERTGRIKENPSKHILAKQFSKGKPSWVYLGEEGLKLLLNSLGANHRALTDFLIDSGIRPEEAWKIRVYDFQDDYKVLDIPEKRENGERVIKKNSFGRKIKLKLCSDLIREYVKLNNLKPNDTLFNITQAGFNKALRVACTKIYGKENVDKPTKAREKPNKITAYDIRHNSACFWLKRYKTNKDLMYRFGWKSENKVFYYTEFLDMRDTIDDDDLITKEDKLKYETEIEQLKKDLKIKEKETNEKMIAFEQKILKLVFQHTNNIPNEKMQEIMHQKIKDE